MIDPVLQQVRHMISLAQQGRCVICGWPLESEIDLGCIIGNCSFRPDERFIDYAGIQMRREIMHGTSFSVIRNTVPSAEPAVMEKVA